MKTEIEPVSDVLPDLLGENADLRAALAKSKQAGVRRDLVNEELKHRITNLLTVVAAIARKTFRDGDPTSVQDFTNRLSALSAAQTLLIDSETKATTLQDVVCEALAAHFGHYDASGPEIALTGRQAYALTLALHELATNALKYGALSMPDGTVSLWWEITDKMLDFHWLEKGGPPVSEPTRRGLGSMLITQILNSAFSGTVEVSYQPCGVTCHLRAPLP